MNLPLGFRYAATYAGIRKEKKPDVALILADQPAPAAAVFTQNVVQAAPVRLARRHLQKSHSRVSALLINAGNANCATRTADRVALETCKAAAKKLKTKREFVLPASTGVIGVEMDAKLIVDALPELVAALSPDAFESAAQAILTTDTRIKITTETVRLRSGAIRIAGMTKGSGMIHPNMATTLGFVMTDAAIGAKDLRLILRRATESSYNSLSVDGDTSTNDMVALLASGCSGVKPGGRDRELFASAVSSVMEDLAQQIARDGEGARKLIIVRVSGAKDNGEARRIARAIANSPLVKTAIGGSDANWGRILTAAGYSGAFFKPEDTDIYLQNVLVCRNGLAAGYDEPALKRLLEQNRAEIRLALKRRGKAEARFFTCDLTEGYIQINGSYRT
ncbi:MAG: bifunctional glutamate N-acetyltransferase/amino-acid acetyltransferase ArgJ [Bryobacteraceae bacterium]